MRYEVHERVADERADGERDERLLQVVVEAGAREPLDREHREQAADADHDDRRRAVAGRARHLHPPILLLVLFLVPLLLLLERRPHAVSVSVSLSAHVIRLLLVRIIVNRWRCPTTGAVVGK